MSMLQNLLRPIAAVLKLLLIGAVAIGAVAFGALVAFTIFLGVSLAKLLRGRGEATASSASDRVFDAEYEVVRRPGRGVLNPLEHDRR